MSRRMTPARIRKAMLLPKPRGALAAAASVFDGRPWLRAPTERQVALLRHIAEHGDLIDHPVIDRGSVFEPPLVVRGQWLLVPLPLEMLDELAGFEADLADLEPDLGDFEPDVDREQDDADAEPSLGAPEGHQGLWADRGAFDREEEREGVERDEGHLHLEHGRGLAVARPRQTVTPVYEANLDDWRRI